MNVFILEGLFYSKSDSIWVQEEGPISKSVEEVLEPLNKSSVRIFLHHMQDRWGVASCFWLPAKCPFGHHINPRSLLHFDEIGVLDYENSSLDTSNGVKTIPLEHLCGHKARLIIMELPKDLPSDLSSIESRADHLKGILSKLKSSLETL